MQSLRRILCAEHRKKQISSSVRYAAEEQLLMVYYKQADNTTILRTVNELLPLGDIKYSIPYRSFCDFTVLQGWLNFLG